MTIQPLLTRLDELEKLSTQGEWKILDNYFLRGKEVNVKFQNGNSRTPFTGANDEDREYIVALVNAYPLLRAEIERLQEVERKYEELRK